MAKKKPLKSRVLPESVELAVSSSVNGGDTPFGGTSNASADRRIADCSQARELFLRLQKENQLRAQSFAQIRNQIEGGRPFDPAVLRKNGEEGRTNCNFNDARSAFIRACLPYWKMVNEVPRKIAITIHTGSPNKNTAQIAMAEAFDMFLDDWGDEYIKEFSCRIMDMVMFGPSYAFWEDAIGPRYKWAQTTQIMFPKRTKATVSKWELVVLQREMTASELIAKVRDGDTEKLSSKAGWNPDAIRKAISMAAPENIQNRLLDPTYWQDMIVANDLVIATTWPSIQVVDEWAIDRKGNIKHYIFTVSGDCDDYIYESEEEEKEFKRIFGPVFYDFGANGLIHSIKGFGVLNYYYATTINRMKCKATDAVGLTMGLNFVKDDDAPDESPPVQNFSFLNVFPKGLTQMTIYPQLQPAMELMKELQHNQNENNYTYDDSGTQQEIAQTDTKGQADLIASISSEGQSSQASIYLSQEARVFGEVFRRLCKKSDDEDAKKFKKRCIALGVPEEFFSEDVEKTVKCGASPSMASAAVRGRIANELLGMANMPGMNVRAIQEFKVANLTGSEGISSFMLPIGVDSDPRARREAMMENEDLSKGIPLPVDPSDAHAEHADEHLKPVEMIVQQAQQGGQPPQVPGQPMNPAAQLTPDHLMALQMLIPHITAHLQFLANDETKVQLYKQLNARLAAVENVARGLFSRLARAQTNGQNSAGIEPGAVATAIQGPRQ